MVVPPLDAEFVCIGPVQVLAALRGKSRKRHERAARDEYGRLPVLTAAVGEGGGFVAEAAVEWDGGKEAEGCVSSKRRRGD